MGRPPTFERDEVIDKAMDLFWRQGYRATTPNDLVDTLGIGKGSLYHAFGSKRELFSLALDRYRDQQAVLIDRALAEPGPIKDRIIAAMRLIIELNTTDADRRGCLAVNTAAELATVDEDAGERVRAMFERTTGAFTDAIRAGQASGELRTDLDADAVALHLLTTLVGLQVLTRTTLDLERLARSVEVAVAAL